VTYQASQKTPFIKCADVLAVARQTTRDTSLDINDIECIAISLLDQGYIMGYIMHSTRLLVLKKDASFGFPKVSTVKAKVTQNDDLDRFG